MALLEVRDLTVTFGTGPRAVEAVKGVSFDLERGETLAIVGESGSGKSVTALSVLQLLPYPAARHGSATRIRFDGIELAGAPTSVLQTVRGGRIGMVFQEPMTSLNPLHTVARQIGETLLLHKGLTGAPARARIIELLSLVGLANAADRLDAYPHQLSGGQRQRVMIAMALATNPSLLIADEPTTGLDVTTQAAIMRLLRDAAADRQMSTVLITHDLALASESCDRIAVMHAGHIVEVASTRDLFERPRHPYTAALIRSVPASAGTLADLDAIPGSLPDLRSPDLPACRFVERCRHAQPRCRELPLPQLVDSTSVVACHFPL